MSNSTNFYKILKKIHLYACLSTAAVLLMYIITSYMMIHHQLLPKQGPTENVQIIKVSPSEINSAGWDRFIKKYQVKGRLNNQRVTSDGGNILQYSSASVNTTIKINANGNEVEIKTREKDLAHSIIGIHRLRGYGGPLKYNLYAVLLDLVGISLIIFTITGVIMWLKLLKNNKWAWGVFIAGAIYYSIVMILLYIG